MAAERGERARGPGKPRPHAAVVSTCSTRRSTTCRHHRRRRRRRRRRTRVSAARPWDRRHGVGSSIRSGEENGEGAAGRHLALAVDLLLVRLPPLLPPSPPSSPPPPPPPPPRISGRGQTLGGSREEAGGDERSRCLALLCFDLARNEGNAGAASLDIGRPAWATVPSVSRGVREFQRCSIFYLSGARKETVHGCGGGGRTGEKGGGEGGRADSRTRSGRLKMSSRDWYCSMKLGESTTCRRNIFQGLCFYKIVVVDGL